MGSISLKKVYAGHLRIILKVYARSLRFILKVYAGCSRMKWSPKYDEPSGLQTESTRILTHILHSYAWILIYNLHKLPWILICSYPTQVRYLLSLIRGILLVGYCYILISASSGIKIHIRVASFHMDRKPVFRRWSKR